MYITNRRVGDTDFIDVQDTLFRQGLAAQKMDGQEIASFLIDRGLEQWVLDILGIDTAHTSTSASSLRAQVRDAFVLFSDDANNFREQMIEHAIMVNAIDSSQPIGRDELCSSTLQSLGVTVSVLKGQCSSAIDRLLQNLAW